MSDIVATCWRSFMFVYLFCPACVCIYQMSTVGFARHDTNYSMPDGFLNISGVTVERCFAKCSTLYECFFVSYSTVSGDCVVSSLATLVTNKMQDEGWSLFRLKPPCEFVTIGAHEIALCSRRMIKAYADNACASFGSWRLIEPRTLDIYWEIVNYILAMPAGKRSLYDSLWVGVEYDTGKGKWLFPDGTQLPLEEANSKDVDGTQRCMRLQHGSSMYKYVDQPCSDEYSYICEKIQ